MAANVPPPEAMKSISKGLYVSTVVLVAILAFVAGLGTYSVLYPQKAGPAPSAALVIGTNTPFPPFEYVDANNTVVGFDIDLITTIMARQNHTYIIRDFRDFGALLQAVQFEGIDVAASSITSSGETGANRREVMSFSDSYFESDQAVLVRASESRVTCPAAPAGCTAANLVNFTIAVQSGTTSQYWVEAELPNATLTKFPDVTQVLTALRTSSVDIVVVDKPVGEAIAAANSADFKLAGTIETNELYSFAVAKDDPKHLLPGINAELARMKSDGTYAQIQSKWFH
jgi:ABC-type amino acid transport substrate-binding protein